MAKLLEASEQPISEESAPTSTPELVGGPLQQIPIEPEPKITQPQPTTETQQQKKPSIEEEVDEENND